MNKISKNYSPSFASSFLPILILIVLLGLNVLVFGEDATYGPNQIALLLAAGIAAVLGMVKGVTWEFILKGIVKSIMNALPAVLILLMIGALAGTWMISGVVPTMIYYGLQILNPSIFLFATCIVCAIISLATGSSWSTVATVGVALLAIGSAMGISSPIIAGAIISGAYFGDKISPMSDTTNLAPAMAGTDLFTHIRYMLLTTIPSIVITLIIFLIIGFFNTSPMDMNAVNALETAITSKFHITPILFIVPLVVIVLIIKKVDAIPALFIGSILGGIAAMIFQPKIIQEIAGETSNYGLACIKTFFTAMSVETSLDAGNAGVNKLISTKGMNGMLNTIWLIVCAMCLGGVMETLGMLQKITGAIVRLAKSTFALISSSALTCIFFNFTASDQYLAIVVPGRMFAKTFRERGLKAENLSRTLEDSGTVTSVLVPWNTCGAAQATVLGVATGDYFMYCFFNLISPLMTMIFAFFNIKIRKYSESEMEEMKKYEEEEALLS
jgi:Na+:H+ antiporter, NhaC family